MLPLSDTQRLLKIQVRIFVLERVVVDTIFILFTFIQWKHHTDGNNLENWAVGLSSNNFRLLCLDGGVRPVQEYQTCNLGKVPAPKVSFSVLVCSERRNSAFFFVGSVYKKKLFCGCQGNDGWLEVCRANSGHPGRLVKIV
jgi:hypothetical protein